MKERVCQLIGSEQAARVCMGTFHSIALRFLRRYGKRIGLRQVQVTPSADALIVITKLMREYGPKLSALELAHGSPGDSFNDVKPSTVQSWISKYKTAGLTAAQCADVTGCDQQETHRRR